MRQTNLLLPHRFQTIGWILLALLFTYETAHAFIPQLQAVANGQTAKGIIDLLLLISLAFIGLSKEKVEDEFISSIRINTVTVIIWIAFTLMIVKDLLEWSWGCLSEDMREASLDMIKPVYEYGRYINLLNVGLLYIIVFRLRIWTNCLKSKKDEKQERLIDFQTERK